MIFEKIIEVTQPDIVMVELCQNRVRLFLNKTIH
jgi:pheromone shutdown protein TraB